MATLPSPVSGSTLANPGGAGGLATEPVTGNSLDKFIRSIEGLTGQQGAGVLGAGLGNLQSGIGAAAPVLSYLTQLVKGDQGDVTEAAQPQIDQITQQFDQIRNMISQQPRGGGKTSALAEAPFQKSAAIQRTEGQMRTGAAGELGGLATNLAGLGLSEAGLGQGLESLSSNIALTKQGLDYSQPSALSQVLSGIKAGASLADVAGSIGSLLAGPSGGGGGGVGTEFEV